MIPMACHPANPRWSRHNSLNLWPDTVLIETLLVVVIVFGSSFTLAVTGFGVALVAMPLLSWLLGVQLAAPLVALYGILLNLVILYHYRLSFNYRATAGIIVSSVIGVPLGVWALSNVDETVVLRLLGLILIGYSSYVLIVPRLPRISPNPAWAFGFGFLAGCLGGAYNAFGPPVIIYGNLRRWSRDEFKSNLQGFFLVNGIVVIIMHAVNGNLTGAVWRTCALAVPASLLGLAAGLWLDRLINPELFRKLVLYLLLLLGLGLLL